MRADFIAMKKTCERCGVVFHRATKTPAPIFRKTRFCSRECAARVVHRTDELARFEENVMPEPNSGCWIWTGTLSSYGYGQIKLNGSLVLAHRHSFERSFGPIPPGVFVCHRCDVRNCVNPDHLFVGTASENNADASKKDRTAYGSRNWSARLTEADVIAARASEASNAELSERYGVSRTAIRNARIGRTWRRASP